MTRAVLDTNVLASGLVGFRKLDSPPGQILRAWRSGQFELIVSTPILVELHRTLAKPYFRKRLTPEQIARTETFLQRRATPATITVTVQGVATHPQDDLILATAISAQADYLVTGDAELQNLTIYEGVTILGPRAFLDVRQRQIQP